MNKDNTAQNATIEFESEVEADQAMRGLNGVELEGSPLDLYFHYRVCLLCN